MFAYILRVFQCHVRYWKTLFYSILVFTKQYPAALKFMPGIKPVSKSRARVSSQFIAKSYRDFYKNFKSTYSIGFVLCFISIFIGCQKKKNVVLITIDTLRADHMGCYGFTRDTIPAIDALSNEGCFFTNVTSTPSWTAPAMASLFTTLMPSQHNIRTRSLQVGEYLWPGNAGCIPHNPCRGTEGKWINDDWNFVQSSSHTETRLCTRL